MLIFLESVYLPLPDAVASSARDAQTGRRPKGTEIITTELSFGSVIAFIEARVKACYGAAPTMARSEDR